MIRFIEMMTMYTLLQDRVTRFELLKGQNVCDNFVAGFDCLASWSNSATEAHRFVRRYCTMYSRVM